MDEIELERLKSIPGWTSDEECLWLHEQASRMNSVVEIGSWVGKSTYALLTGCSGDVWAVDHFNGSPSEIDTNHREANERDLYLDFMENVGMFKNLKVLKMDSLIAASFFLDRSVDMIFIDGEHTVESFTKDLIAWSPKCSKFLCGHDIDWDQVALSLEVFGIRWKTGPGSLWYLEINGSQAARRLRRIYERKGCHWLSPRRQYKEWFHAKPSEITEV